MIKLINNTASEFELSFTAIPPSESIEFHAIQFEEAEFYKLFYHLGSGDISFVQDDLELDEKSSNTLLNRIMNETPPMGVGVLDSIISWSNHGESIGYDYKYVRKKIQELTLSIPGIVSDEERKESTRIAAEFVAMPFDQVAAEVGPRFEHVLSEWGKRSKKCRSSRLSRAIDYIQTALSPSDSKEVVVDLTTGQSLFSRYEIGIEGTVEDEGKEGIYDYILSRPGTSFEASGLSTKSFSPINGETISQVSNRAYLILSEGAK